MGKFTKLKRDALTACKLRGHSMGRWFTDEKYRFAECQLCLKEVTINTKPLPNEIDISGEAVALGCND